MYGYSLQLFITPPPLYVILWYRHITWYRPVHLDWWPSENWYHWVKNASTWSWSHDISVSSHVLSFYFGDWSCLRRIWPSSVFDIVVFGLWVSVQGFVSVELWKNWRWAFEWLSLCHLMLGMRHTHLIRKTVTSIIMRLDIKFGTSRFSYFPRS